MLLIFSSLILITAVVAQARHFLITLLTLEALFLLLLFQLLGTAVSGPIATAIFTASFGIIEAGLGLALLTTLSRDPSTHLCGL